jgi:hypothetical protein
MSKKLPAHAGGTAKAGRTATVPPAPVKDHSRDAEQLDADQQARERAASTKQKRAPKMVTLTTATACGMPIGQIRVPRAALEDRSGKVLTIGPNTTIAPPGVKARAPRRTRR